MPPDDEAEPEAAEPPHDPTPPLSDGIAPDEKPSGEDAPEADELPVADDPPSTEEPPSPAHATSEDEVPSEAEAPSNDESKPEDEPPSDGEAPSDGDSTPEAEQETVARDRAALQAELRQQRKKEKRHRHRWLRRTAYSLLAIVLLAAAGAGGLYLYAGYRFDQIKKVHAKHLVKQAPPGKPFNILLVGSDSRAFVVNATQQKAFGSGGAVGGQRSDVTMVARFVPATKSVTILSIPRDLWVDIPANKGNFVGMNRINSAYDAGPDVLIQTIEKDLNIPINHYMSVNFDGFQGMVDALGGIYMDFSTPVRDSYSGLNVTTLGCQLVAGPTALELVRARHLEYKNANGYWTYDGLSDFSRIQRQDAFFRAVLAKVNQSLHNPFALNGFISAAVTHLTIDDTLGKGELFSLATSFRGLSSSNLITETLPTVGYVTDGGADVLLAAEPYADTMIKTFNQIGLPKPPPPKPLPVVAHNLIGIEVYNSGAAAGAAHDMATALTAAGYTIAGVADAPTPIATGSPSEIWYGPTGEDAAHTLGASLTGSFRYVSDPSLTGNSLALFIAGLPLSVTDTTTTTTVPGSSTTTTIPGDIYTNQQAEPWNPTPCTPGSTARQTSR